jgi:anti-sigma B factor antagonist
MAELLQIEIGGDGLHRTLLLRGAMDLSSSQEFMSALERVCGGGAREVVLDLGGVDFIDSLGLHTLLRGRAYCEKRGCAYKLRPSLPPRIQRVFNVAGVNEYIPFQEAAGADG